MANLEIKTGNDKKIIPFRGPAMKIGRAAENDIVLEDKAASRRHCVIEQRGAAFHVKDLNSHNGTWMGENRILEANLTFDQTLRIGSTFIRLLPEELHAAPAKQPLPVAEIVEESPEELPPSSPDKSKVATSLAVRAMVTGPLSRQLSTLMEACINIPIPKGAPSVAKDLRLLNRRGEALAPDGNDRNRPVEALDGFRQLLFAVFRTGATDIHIEPKADIYAIRFRIDGLLHSVGEIPSKMGITILNVIKILCELDIAKKNIVQEGSFAIELPDRRVDFRINMTPTAYGQKLALRVLDKATVPSQFENLGMELDIVSEVTRVCQQDAGMIILSGPTGSGKTTTLYTALQTIDARTRNIITIEDPVEYELDHATQISIDPTHDVTFASVLASVLRQDPDVILVGEIRDKDTARLAMQAATTGHLVLTTLHARDTVGTVFRLLDLGVEPFLIANSVTMCISQRLVRVLCPNCKRAYKPDAQLVRRIKLEGRAYGQFYDAVGCKRCMGTGYRGRIALYETLVFTPQVRDVILTNPTIADIRRAAGEWMFQTLAESGYRKVIEGVTSVTEVERVSGT